MDVSRQDLSANKIIEQKRSLAAIVKKIHMKKNTLDALHRHTWHQLIFPIRGLIQTQVERQTFLVPHTSAIFVPANLSHESKSLTDTIFIGVYINPDYCRCFGSEIKPISVTIFIRELILTLKDECQSPEVCNAKVARLIDVLHDQLQANETVDFKLLVPNDRRINIIFERLLADPSITYTLDEWGIVVGATKRTLTRLYTREFSTSFSLWRQHLRLISSLPLLESDYAIHDIAHKVGYQNDSSYIKAFKTRFGSTPQSFRSQRQKTKVGSSAPR